MQKRTCRDVSLSLLGFGCMRFPETNGQIDEPAAFAMLDAAYEAGVNYYDTAYPYHGGQSEILVGKWLKTKKRDSLYLTSKLPCWKIDAPEQFEIIFAEQMAKLDTPYLDFYLLHSLDRATFQKMKALGALEFMEKLKAEGKIKHIGFSFHDDYDAFEEILTAYPWDVCQIQYNYMDTEIQAGDRGYALAKKLGIPLLIMEPVKGGNLANPPAEVRKALALHAQWSPASWALRWVAHHDNVAVILSGMSTMEQVMDNVHTLSEAQPLSDAELSAVAQAAEIYRSRIRVGCTGCRYCMPCPAGVNIPGVVRAYNQSAIYSADGTDRRAYLSIPADARATACVACRKCAEACPQHLDIPGFMVEIQSWAEK